MHLDVMPCSHEYKVEIKFAILSACDTNHDYWLKIGIVFVCFIRFVSPF